MRIFSLIIIVLLLGIVFTSNDINACGAGGGGGWGGNGGRINLAYRQMYYRENPSYTYNLTGLEVAGGGGGLGGYDDSSDSMGVCSHGYDGFIGMYGDIYILNAENNTFQHWQR